jgi:alpha-tubulin suppressor-like RCC1 family protein
VATGGDTTCALKNDGTVWCWGENDRGQLCDGTTVDKPYPIKAPVTGVIKIAMNLSTVFALTSDGDVYSWGYNGV